MRNSTNPRADAFIALRLGKMALISADPMSQFDRHLTKPFDIEDLETVIQEFLVAPR
jgi:hypothetical protein